MKIHAPTNVNPTPPMSQKIQDADFTAMIDSPSRGLSGGGGDLGESTEDTEDLDESTEDSGDLDESAEDTEDLGESRYFAGYTGKLSGITSCPA